MTGRNLLTLNLVDKSASSSQLQENTDTAWTKWEEFKGDAGAGLFADPMARARPKRLRWLGASFALQALAVGFWLAHSVTVESELPAPRVVKTFLTVAPVTPPPPPPKLVAVAASTSSQGPTPARAPLAPPTPLAAITPTPMPIELGHDLGAAFEDGDPAGVPGGVIGGLVGGLGNAPAPPERQTEPAIYVVTGKLERPDKLVHVDPVYPGIATVARVEGVVILEAIIDGDGNVEALRVLRSVPLLDDAAIDAVKRWKYEPTIIGGKAVSIQMTVTIKFALA